MLGIVKWIFLTRRKILKTYLDTTIHWSSRVDEDSSLSQYNSLGRRTRLFQCSLGRGTYVASDTKISRSKIGSFCSIGQECLIGGLGAHPTNWLSTHPAFFSNRKQANFTFTGEDKFEEISSVSIGSDVWIGARAMILDGCDIGDGAVIAAGAVVTKNVPPYAIVGGVPAKIIRYRFDSKTIQLLIKMQWWNLPLLDISNIDPTPTGMIKIATNGLIPK